jgi:polar amino acid transport system substrate-binding protein
MKFANGLKAVLALASIALIGGAPARAAEPVYKVGSTPSGVPFTFLDVKTNTIEGVMVDLIRAIGEKSGFKVEIDATQWSALIPSLTGNKIDIIAAAMFATAERAKVIDFSEPVYTYGEGLFVADSDSKAYQSFADMKGYTVGVQVGTAFIDPLKKAGVFKEVKVYDTIPDIMRDVSLGRINAGFADYPIVAYNLAQNSSYKVHLVKSYKPVIVGSVAIAVRKGDKALLDKINGGLGKLKASGEVEKILKKWNVE